MAAAEGLVHAGHTVLLSGVVVTALFAGLPRGASPDRGALDDYVSEMREWLAEQHGRLTGKGGAV